MFEEDSSPTLSPPPAENAHVTILVVDDEPGMRYILSLALARYGFKVLTAHSGDGALELVRDRRGERIDVMVTDLAMPGMNGVRLADTLSELYPRLKVIYTSGFPVAVAQGFGINVHRDTFLPKPISTSVLHAAIVGLQVRPSY